MFLVLVTFPVSLCLCFKVGRNPSPFCTSYIFLERCVNFKRSEDFQSKDCTREWVNEYQAFAKVWLYEKGKKKTSLNSKVVQEYERAVVFRLGRLPKGGDKGPGHKQSYCSVICACTKILKGLHFVLPCTEKLTAIDLRTQVFDVVPQEVNDLLFHRKIIFVNIALTLENAGRL